MTIVAHKGQPINLEELTDLAGDQGRQVERDDVGIYLEAEAASWEACDRDDIAGVLRKFARDLREEKHLSDSAWIPKSRPST